MVRRRTVLATACLMGVPGCLGDGGRETSDDDDSGPDYTGPMVGDTELRHNYPVVFEDPESGDRVVEIHYHGEGNGEWHFQPLTVEVGETREFAIRLDDAEADPLPLEDGYDLAPQAFDETIVALSVDGDQIVVEGLDGGETEVAFDVTGPDGGSWRAPALRILVEE